MKRKAAYLRQLFLLLAIYFLVLLKIKTALFLVNLKNIVPLPPKF